MLAGTTQHGTKYWSSNEVLATFPIVPTARVYNHYHLPAGQQAKKHTEAAWRLQPDPFLTLTLQFPA